MKRKFTHTDQFSRYNKLTNKMFLINDHFKYGDIQYASFYVLSIIRSFNILFDYTKAAGMSTT